MISPSSIPWIILSAADDTMQNDTADDICSKGNKSYYKKVVWLMFAQAKELSV